MNEDAVGGPLVLIVDDHEDSREVCAALLELYGYNTCVAASVTQGLECAHRLHPAALCEDLLG